jgi:hypothetical protein
MEEYRWAGPLVSAFEIRARISRNLFDFERKSQMQRRIPAGAFDISWFHNIPYANFRPIGRRAGNARDVNPTNARHAASAAWWSACGENFGYRSLPGHIATIRDLKGRDDAPSHVVTCARTRRIGVDH